MVKTFYQIYTFFAEHFKFDIFKILHCCYCKKINKKCAFCEIQTVFSGFEKTICENRKNLVACPKRHLPLLMRIFEEDKTAVDCFLDDEYVYTERDWYTGETCCVYLRESIDYSNSIKKKNANNFI